MSENRSYTVEYRMRGHAERLIVWAVNPPAELERARLERPHAAPAHFVIVARDAPLSPLPTRGRPHPAARR
jgi:hypothetical protein